MRAAVNRKEQRWPNRGKSSTGSRGREIRACNSRAATKALRYAPDGKGWLKTSGWCRMIGHNVDVTIRQLLYEIEHTQ